MSAETAPAADPGRRDATNAALAAQEGRACGVSTPIVALVGLALAVRLVVALATPGHGFDLGVYAQWAAALRDHGLGDFYSAAGDTADHLPGDLYLHRLLVAACSAVGIDPGTHGYVLALKLVANLADVAAAALAWALVRRQRPDDPRCAAAVLVAMLLAPSTIVLAAAWGQWDTVSVVLLLGGALLLPGRAWWASPALFAWACLVKPQLGLAVVALVGVWLLGRPLRDAMERALVAGGIGVATVLALCAPFSVGLPLLGARWSLPGRIAYAGDLYPFTSLGAPNIWQLHLGRDDATAWGLTYRTIGHLLLLGCLAVLAWRLHRNAGTTDRAGGGTWLAALAMWAFYVCETRCHERYLVPAAALLLVHAAMSGWRRREAALAGGLVLVLAVTLVVHLAGLNRATVITADRWLAVADIGLFLVALLASRPAEAPAGAIPLR